jgi:hypothetical protein
VALSVNILLECFLVHLISPWLLFLVLLFSEE